MNEVQLIVTRASDGSAVQVTDSIDQLVWTTRINGGFGTASLFIPGKPQEVFMKTGLEYLGAIQILGPGGAADVLFDGEIQDLQQVVTDGRIGVGVEAAGWQRFTDEPYRAAPILKDIAQRVVPMAALNSLVRNSYWAPNAGAGAMLGAVASAGDENGFTITAIPSVVAPANTIGGIQCDFPVRITRLKFTLSSFTTNGSAAFGIAQRASYTATSQTLLNVSSLSNLSPTAHDLAFASGYGNSIHSNMSAFNITGGFATSVWVFLNQIRALAPRGPSALDNEPVYGHELVQDVIFNSLLTKDYSNVDTDTTYQFGTADFSGPGTTLRSALEYITAFYDRYWAVYENKTLYWKPSTLSGTPDWTIQADTKGVQYDVQPSVDQAARSVRVAYRDVQGITREVTASDTRLDNVYALAGASKQAQVSIPVVSNSSAAQQIANTYFPDHSYEVQRGNITIPAAMLIPTSKQGGGALPAYKIRAGDSIRLNAAAQPRDYFSTAFDRKTLLLVRSSTVDWEAQTITLEVDNTRDRMTTLLARIQAQVQTRFPGT